MMNYFATAEHQSNLWRVIEDWRGVPYRHMGMSKGGVDCTKFVGLVCVDLGILAKVDEAYYGRDWYLHSDREVVLESLERHVQYLAAGLQLRKLPNELTRPQSLQFGDVLCMTTGKHKACNHAAIYLGDNKMVHCLASKGVHIAQYLYFWASRTRFLYRLETN